jgi:dTDP-4-dehydrorhamnose reductase
MKIAILGSRGRLGADLLKKWSTSGPDGETLFTAQGFARPKFDLLDAGSIDRALGPKKGYDWVINCAANTNVDACERQPEEARLANTVAARYIAERCAKIGARFIHISTDYVFDGRQRTPYDEDSRPSPLGVYALSKADGEFGVLAALPTAIVARVSWVFGPEKPSFIDMLLSRALGDSHVSAVADKWSTPTYTSDIAQWLAALIGVDAPGGMYHLCNAGQCSWQEFGEHALRCADTLGLPVKTTTVKPLKLKEMDAFAAERPIYTVMSTKRFTEVTKIEPRPWQDAVWDYLRDYPPC